MGAAAYLLLLLTHPYEFRTLLQFKLFHEYKRDITAKQEHPTSGWDRKSMQRCWTFLDMTSRSFSAVIKELEGDLARTIALFYLVLRGLDTIEDDMTIPDHLKQPLLRNFHVHTVTPGWTFNGSGPDEKDRQLLVEYDQVVAEVNLLNPEYKAVIIDIAQKMATGMADFTHYFITTQSTSLPTIESYDLYCHYVAGLVGEGLSRIFSASGKEAPWLGDQLELSNSMGLLLQKTNIIRDFREDVEEGRFFWPKEVWGSEQYGGFKSMGEMRLPVDPVKGAPPAHRDQALFALSHMILDALRHTTDALTYLRVLKNQSVFNFCAIPATMAIATLELCFMNEEVFKRNIKIRRAESARLIMGSTNPREVAAIFRDYARRIHAKAVPQDPNFVKIAVQCGKIEQWCEQHYPSFIDLKQGPPDASGKAKAQIALNPQDARSRIVLAEEACEKDLAIKRRASQLKNTALDPRRLGQQDNAVREIATYLLVTFGLMGGLCLGLAWLVIRLYGNGNEPTPSPLA